MARRADGRRPAGHADRVPVRAVELIERKRDGGEHAPARSLAGRRLPRRPRRAGADERVVHGGRLARALGRRDRRAVRTRWSSRATTVDLSSLGRTVVDKHSTGGVGDKMTIALAPLVAACGVPVAKMSGRGLGHTGGTLDKLEAIPGFRIGLGVPRWSSRSRASAARSSRRPASSCPPTAAVRAARRHGHGAGARPDRDVGDVEEARRRRRRDGARREGRGRRLLPDVEEARELARLMRGLGARAGRPMVCELTRMDAPLGDAVGNALEVAEAFDVLRGGGPADVRELVLASAARMAGSPTWASTRPGAAGRGGDRLGRGAAGARALVEAQGGDPRLAEQPWGVLERAPVVRAVPAPRGGYVARCGALAIGRAAMRLGAGRARKEDPIDHAVGRRRAAKPGDAVAAGARSRTCTPATRPPRGAPLPRCSPPTDRRRARGAAAAAARDDRLMPELPEGLTVRQRLVPRLTGRVLAEVEIFDHRLTDPEPPSAVTPASRAPASLRSAGAARTC